MTISLNNLKTAYGSTKRKVRIGRGNSSGRGTYSTKGLKGQKARTGASGLKYLGMKASIMKYPKMHGFKSLNTKLAVVNLADLEKNFKDGDKINFAALLNKDLLRKRDKGVKILGAGELKKKFIIKVDQISESARTAVEKAGGTVIDSKQKTSSISEKK